MKRDVKVGNFHFPMWFQHKTFQAIVWHRKKKIKLKRERSLYLPFKVAWKFGLLWRLVCDVYWKKLEETNMWVGKKPVTALCQPQQPAL